MTIAEQLTIAKADLDAVYEAGKAAGGGGGNRKEYSGKIGDEIKGTSACVDLCTDDLLAEIRTLDTLFVRVECFSDSFSNEEERKYAIVKNWASNVSGEVFPVAYAQLVYRYGGDGNRNFGTLTKTLYDDPSGGVGLLHITENGKLLFYSGSPNYKIIPCDFKVIVEW